MKLYQYKPLPVGFVVLCPDRNVGMMRTTVRGIQNRYPGSSVLAVVGNDVSNEELAEMNLICTTLVGKDTITSLINEGMDNSSSHWTMIVMEGSRIRQGIDKKYSFFVDDERDILFPIANGQTNFIDGSINGIMMKSTTWSLVGPFCNEGSLSECKTMWSSEAVSKGCRFKAILGALIC